MNTLPSESYPSGPSLTELLEAEQDVKDLAHCQAFELAMLEKLVARDTRYQSDDSFTIHEDFTPPGLSDILSSEQNHIGNVDIELSTTRITYDTPETQTSLRIRFTANNIDYALISDLDSVHLIFEANDGREISIEKSIDDVIGLVASLTLCVQVAEKSVLAPERLVNRPDLMAHNRIEQLLFTVVKETGKIEVVTKALFDESDNKTILSIVTESETEATEDTISGLSLSELTNEYHLPQETELKQFDTILPVEEHTSFATVQTSNIPPRDFAFYKLNDLPDFSAPDFIPEELSPHETPEEWQLLCYRFMQTLAPIMAPYRAFDDSPYSDEPEQFYDR